MRVARIEVVYDPHGCQEVDGDEWAYTLRMGGIDAESVTVLRPTLSTPPKDCTTNCMDGPCDCS